MPRKKRLPAVIEANDTPLSGMTDKQQAFVQAFARTGARKASAVEAGYAEATASAEAHRQLSNPLILQAVEQEVRRLMIQHVPAALGTIVELSQSAKSGMVRLMAAQDLMDRAGFKPVEKQMHAVAGELKVTIDLG